MSGHGKHTVNKAQLRRMFPPDKARMLNVTPILQEMEDEVRIIEKDDRYPHEKEQIATVVVNAPLALIQLEMRVRRATIMKYAKKLAPLR